MVGLLLITLPEANTDPPTGCINSLPLGYRFGWIRLLVSRRVPFHVLGTKAEATWP